MARFRATVRACKSNSTEASRLGHRYIETRAASWAGAVRVRFYAEGDIDLMEISFEQHHGEGDSGVLYRGPVGKFPGAHNAQG